MKKTFAILMAMAGVAMGADEQPLTLQWEGNNASFTSIENGDITITALFDWNTITKTDAGDGKWLLSVNGSVFGLGMDTYDGANELGLWADDRYDYQTLNYGLAGLVQKYDSEAKYISVVFSLSHNDNEARYELREDVYVWDESNNLLDSVTATGDTKQWTSITEPYPYNGISINTDYLSSDSILVYNKKSTDFSDLKDIADNVLPSGSIPEPATATLSLLALAGLAARRRRK